MRIKQLAFPLLISFPVFVESVRVQVIDVAQADGIAIRTPSNNNWIVIDAGISNNFLTTYLRWACLN